MLNLKDGTLWQWDTGRKIIITLDKGHTIDKVQFYNGIGDNAYQATSIEKINGEILAGIPNSLLCYANNLTVYLMTTDEDGIKTQEQITLVVNKRAKPEDYIFEEDTMLTWREHEQRIDELEKDTNSIAEEIEDARTDSNGITKHKTLGASIRTQVNKLEREKIGFEKDTQGNPIHGRDGQYAVSDGEGNVKFIDAGAETDKTLTRSGVPADALATGDKIKEIEMVLKTITNTSYSVGVSKIQYMGQALDTREVNPDQFFGNVLEQRFEDAEYFVLYEEGLLKGDVIKINDNWKPTAMSGYCEYIIIFGEDGHVIASWEFEEFAYGVEYTLEEPGSIIMCSKVESLSSDTVLFDIKRNTIAEVVLSFEYDIEKHNTNQESHNDIRVLIKELDDRLNAVADSEDIDLDQLSEIVDYIKSNRSLIDSITTSKVSITDIVDNLTTNVTNKPLSASQGVAIKSLIDNLSTAISRLAGAEANQNAFSHIMDNDGTIISATSETDTLQLKGMNIRVDDSEGESYPTILFEVTKENVESALGYEPLGTSKASEMYAEKEVKIKDGFGFIENKQDLCAGTETGNGSVRDLTYGNGKFFLVGYTGVIYISEDGMTWNKNAEEVESIIRTTIAYGNGKFVSSIGKGLYYSEDGVRWQKGVIPGESSNKISFIYSLNYCNGLFFALCNLTTPSSTGVLLSSEDGINWNQVMSNSMFYSQTTMEKATVLFGHTSQTNGTLNEETKYVMLIKMSNGFKCNYSSDGASWQSVNITSLGKMSSFLYHNGIFVAIGVSSASSSNKNMLYSRDGINWSKKTIPDVFYYAIPFQDKFIAIGKSGVYESQDCWTWSLTDNKSLLSFLPDISASSESTIVVAKLTQNLVGYYGENITGVKTIDESINDLYKSYAPLESPVFTSDITATDENGNKYTLLTHTHGGYAPLDNPTFLGDAKATDSDGTNVSLLALRDYVVTETFEETNVEMLGGGGGAFDKIVTKPGYKAIMAFPVNVNCDCALINVCDVRRLETGEDILEVSATNVKIEPATIYNMSVKVLYVRSDVSGTQAE